LFWSPVPGVEAAASDLVGHQADETMLWAGMPREQREGHVVNGVVHLDLFGIRFDHDAPQLSGFGVVAVYPEGHSLADKCRGKLRALGRAEHDRVVVDGLVDRKMSRYCATDTASRPTLAMQQLQEHLSQIHRTA
jgi:hypothetical protein